MPGRTLTDPERSWEEKSVSDRFANFLTGLTSPFFAPN